MCIRTIDQPNTQGTPDVNGKLNNIDSLIKTIKYNKLWRCGRLQSSQIYQHQLTIRAPTLCTRPNLRLLAPTKSGLRNPTLRVRKTQLACRIEKKTTSPTQPTLLICPQHLSSQSTVCCHTSDHPCCSISTAHLLKQSSAHHDLPHANTQSSAHNPQSLSCDISP